MASANRSSLHVGKPKRRNSSSKRRRNVLKAAVAGLSALAIGSSAIAAAVMGTGWLLAVPQARQNVRSLTAIAPPPGQLARINIGAPTQLAILASLSPPPARFALEPNPVEHNVALALGNRDAALPDPDFTGSIGGDGPKLAALELPPAGPVSRSPLLPELGPAPLPRSRPRLAALPPADNPGIKLDDGATSPRTAIYDITAQTVYMPNGERLEAHSGLGSLMDNPRHVRIKDRGATPPNTYRLKLRESLFHGVQAIRLTPLSESDMFGRDGILAHSYMLGPSGQSNGCVSFKDYPKFLQAFMRGEVDRMIVVPRLDRPPAFYARSNGRSNTL